MPRPANPEVRARLIAAGTELIHTRGFNGCGVKDITDAASVPKGSFYNYFQSKEAFAVEVLVSYWNELERRHSGLLKDPSASPVERVTRFFHALADEHESHGFALGCLIGNLSLELASSSASATEQVKALLARWEMLIAATLSSGQADGSVSDSRDPRELAAILIEAWEGAALRGKVDRQRAPYQRFEDSVLPRVLTLA